mmetsp:Transcript_13962/g.42595  ORF Transcript_13962/g.42595 Transcript_13962/m.42595 type:complete len:92 (+) Transcript_13962:3378-3653(+)
MAPNQRYGASQLRERREVPGVESSARAIGDKLLTLNLVGDVPSSAEASLEKTSAGKKSRSTSNESDVHGPPTKGYADLTKKSVHKWSQPST